VEPRRKKRVAPGRWTAADLKTLRRLAGEAPLWRIAQELGRSELSVKWKAKQEEISLIWRFTRKKTYSRARSISIERLSGVPFRPDFINLSLFQITH
jgi:hypothetical protein